MALIGKIKKNKTSIVTDELKKKAEDLGVEAIKTVPKNIEGSVINIIPQEVAEKNRMVVFEKDGMQIKVAMADPQDINALNVLRFFAEKEKVESSRMRIPAIFGTALHKHSNVHRDCKCALAIERYHKKCLMENPLDAVR